MRRFLCSLLVTASVSFATGPTGLRAADLLPEVRQQGDASYVSGGVGLDERQELEALGTEFNLKLTFALASRSFLSDVPVRVLDGQGQVVLEAISDGPLFFARLVPGTYTVEAGEPEAVQRKAVNVTAGRQTQANFFWRGPSAAEPEPLPTPEELGRTPP